jgi:hypothetical protein
MFPVGYKDKQRLCNDLKIPMDIQRTLSNDPVMKKKKDD